MIGLKRIELGQKKIILIILFCLIIAYVDFTVLVNWQLGSIKNIAPKIVKLKKDLNNLTQDLKNMQELKNKQVDAKKNILAKSKNTVRIMQMNPSRELSAQKTQKAPTAERLTPVFITLDLSSDYHNLGKFINDLENANIFLAAQSIKIESVQPDLFKQHVNLVLLTYVKK
jgi:Tfp pilus assembly protein PilO